METYARILTIAMPIFFLAVMAEKLYGWFKYRHEFKNMDTISSLSSGVTNVLKDALGLGISIITYEWMVRHWALFEIRSTVWVYIIAFVALDLAGYLGHALSHKVNILWNRHLIHHSSEEFNLACALRQSISGIVNFFTIFLLPAALVGVPAQVIAVVAPLHLFAQFWYHTVYIGKLGFLEHIIVTPSHHRVHHAINPQYIDKNHSQIFIIWDKLFGTFQEELPDVPPVYGITVAVRTWNPVRINWSHLWQLAQDAWHTRNWWDKLRIWFMPTGWRPADVADRYPIKNKIQDVYRFEKYAPAASRWLIGWSWFQFFVVFFLVVHLFSNLTAIGYTMALVYVFFLVVSIMSFTELMDRNPWAWLWELVKNATGIGLIAFQGSWFGIDAVAEGLTLLVGGYFVLATLVVLAFTWFDLGQKSRPGLPTGSVA